MTTLVKLLLPVGSKAGCQDLRVFDSSGRDVLLWWHLSSWSLLDVEWLLWRTGHAVQCQFVLTEKLFPAIQCQSPARLQRGQPISVLWSEVLHVRQSVSDLALFWAYVYNMRLVIGSFAHRNLPDISGYGGATRGDSDCCCCCCRLRELCLPIAAMVYVFPVRHPGGCNGDPGLHQSAALRSFQKMRGVAWLGTLTWSCERLSNA